MPSTTKYAKANRAGGRRIRNNKRVIPEISALSVGKDYIKVTKIKVDRLDERCCKLLGRRGVQRYVHNGLVVHVVRNGTCQNLMNIGLGGTKAIIYKEITAEAAPEKDVCPNTDSTEETVSEEDVCPNIDSPDKGLVGPTGEVFPETNCPDGPPEESSKKRVIRNLTIEDYNRWAKEQDEIITSKLLARQNTSGQDDFDPEEEDIFEETEEYDELIRKAEEQYNLLHGVESEEANEEEEAETVSTSPPETVSPPLEPTGTVTPDMSDEDKAKLIELCKKMSCA